MQAIHNYAWTARDCEILYFAVLLDRGPIDIYSTIQYFPCAYAIKKFVWLTITTTCSKFQYVRTEPTKGYLEKYKFKGNNSAKYFQTTYLLCSTP